MPSVIGNTITDSEVTIVTLKTINDLYNEQISTIQQEIESIVNTTERRNLLRELNNIKSHITADLADLNVLLNQINCQKLQNDTSQSITLSKTIHLFILAKLFDESCILPTSNSNKLIVNNTSTWLFNSAMNAPVSLGMHIGHIADFLETNNNCDINNGVCFISSLLHNGGLNCSTCSHGKLEIIGKMKRILPDFFDIKGTVHIDEDERQVDFFNLQKNKKIEFKCGNCVTNIFDIDNAKEKL